MPTTLHPTLAADCHLLGQLQQNYLLLHSNALVPWFILVPDTQQNEIYKLPAPQQLEINKLMQQLAAFTEDYFSCDKLNIATIGNLVPQLHIHIIGRFHSDPWWPAPVWGQPESEAYAPQKIAEIKQALVKAQLIDR